MPRVVIQPAFGGAAARQHWRDTLDSEVKFTAAPYSAVLSAVQLASLADMHPAGQARFFGATKIHDRTIGQLLAGDVILFTGGKRVRAVGEMGVILQDAAAFGDLMWSPDPRNGSYFVPLSPVSSGLSMVTQSFREAGRLSRRRAAIQHISLPGRRPP
jgi:hypothetical protein